MAKNSEAERIFKPSLSSAELRAKNTTHAARTIIDEETAKRERKTARLRAARLANGTEEQAAATAQGKTDKTHKRKQSSPGANTRLRNENGSP
jgi:hypothetical protein